MRQINASTFKQQCLALLDNLDPEGLIITKHGKPIARVMPPDLGCRDLIGSMRGKIQIHGYILSTGIQRDAHS